MTDKPVSILKPIHAQFRAAQLLVCSLIITAAVPLSSLPTSSDPSVPVLPTASDHPFFSKSAAQGGTLVGPQVAPPKSGELACLPKPRRRQELRRKRASPVKVRLDDDEREVVRGKAAKVGMSVNAFIKCLILGFDYDPILRKILLALNREFTAQGNNLNQIARLGNSGKITEMEGDSLLAVLARSHLRTHRIIRNALSRGQQEPQL